MRDFEKCMLLNTHVMTSAYLFVYVILLKTCHLRSSNLRSSVNTLLLKYPTLKSLATLGDRSFTFAAPKLWNKLPCDIRNASNLDHFERLLKTHLFREAYSHYS